MMDDAVFRQGLDALLALPDIDHAHNVYQQLLDVSPDPETRMTDLIRIQDSDTSARTRLLSIANSPHYWNRSQTRVDAPREAITLVGRDTAEEIMLAATSRSLFRATDSVADYSPNKLWKHSLIAAVACRRIYRSRFDDINHDAFLAGLWHDVGIVFEHRCWFQEGFAQAVQTAADSQVLLTLPETDQLGVTHEQTGAYVAQKWALPDHIAAAMGHHHDTSCSGMLPQRYVHVVRLAEYLCFEMGLGYCDFPESYAETLLASQEQLDIDDETVLGIAQALTAEVEELDDFGWFSRLQLRRTVFPT